MHHTTSYVQPQSPDEAKDLSSKKYITVVKRDDTKKLSLTSLAGE